MKPKKKHLHPVTHKQAEILAFIREYREQRGFSPSIQDIANHFLVNINAISCQLKSLEEKGAITRVKGKVRTLMVVEAAA